MSAEDVDVDDGPPLLTAFEYPPEESDPNEPLFDEPINESLNRRNLGENQCANNNHVAHSNDGTATDDDDGEASQEQIEEGEEEGEDQDSNKASSDSKRRRRHKRRKSDRHRRKEKKKEKDEKIISGMLPVDYLVAGAPVVGEWATLLNMYQQQYPSATGDEGRGHKVAGDSPHKRPGKEPSKSSKTAKSQYDVDDVDPYATPEGSGDEAVGPVASSESQVGPQLNSTKAGPFADHNSYQNDSYGNHSYPPDHSYPPRKRQRDEAFGNYERAPSPGYRGRFYNERGKGGYRGGYDDYYDERRGGARSPGDWGRGRRDRGGPRRGGSRGGRRDYGDYNDYDQAPIDGPPPPPQPPHAYESRQFDDGPYGHPPDRPPFQPHHDPAYVPPPPQPSAIDRDFGPPEGPPRSFDEDRPFRGRDQQWGPPQQQVPPPSAQPQQPQRPPDRPGMICKFFREGNCLKGNNCNFAHIHPSEIKRKPDLCKFYLSGFCIKGNDCDYMHEQFPCKFFHVSGNCRNGTSCRFSHAPLDDEGRKMLEKAIAVWAPGPQAPQQPGEPGYFQPPQDQQQQTQFNGNGQGFYGHDILGGTDQNPNSNGAPPPSSFQSPPQRQYNPYDETNRPSFDQSTQPPFQGGVSDFVPPPPPNFPPMPPFPQHQSSFFPPSNSADLSSPPQPFRPPNNSNGPQPFQPTSPGYQAPQMPPLPPSLSAEQIHQLASGLPPGIPPPPFGPLQSPPLSMPPLPEPKSESAVAITGDPRVNRTSSDSQVASNPNRLIRYKLISVLIPPPVPLSLALRLDPLDPIIKLDPRLRKVFGVTS